MTEYKIVKTVAGNSRDSYLRRYKSPDTIVYEIYKKVLWFWVYVDYEFSGICAKDTVQWKLGKSPAQLTAKEAMKRGPEEIGRYKG